MKFTVNNENSALEILSDGFITVLSQRKNTVIQWPYCGGSLGQYLFLNEGFEAYEIEKRINDKLIFQDKVDQETISTILKILPSGNYEVTYGRINQIHIVRSKKRSETIFYQYDTFVMTQSIDTIDESRVNYYKDLIIKGHRPKVVTLSTSLDHSAEYYIIDGHHKLLAYHQLKEDPTVLEFHLEYTIEEYKRLINKNSNLVLDLVSELNPNLIQHIIRNNPKVFYGTSKNEKEYNLNLHQYLSNTKRVEYKLVELLESEFNKNTKDSNLWVRQKVEMIVNSLSIKEKIYVSFRNKEKTGSTISSQYITNKESFCEWLKNILGDDYKNRLGEF